MDLWLSYCPNGNSYTGKTALRYCKRSLKIINSYLPSAAYMHQRTGSVLVPVMAWCLFSTKPLPVPMLTSCWLDLKNKLQWNSNQNTQFFIHENAFENVVCEMAAILSEPQCVESHNGINSTGEMASFYWDRPLSYHVLTGGCFIQSKQLETNFTCIGIPIVEMIVLCPSYHISTMEIPKLLRHHLFF